MNFVLHFCWMITMVHTSNIRRPIGEFETYPPDYFKRLRSNADIVDSEVVVAFVTFRHGDNTPNQEELDLYPEAVRNKSALFPYGPKALTNKGKLRSYHVGTYLRRRYDSLINRLYVPEEVVIWTTDYARTKMAALTAMAGLFPPPPPQRWNNMLDWQPVPYSVLPYDEDDMLYFYNCPRYSWLKDQLYKLPEVNERIAPYQVLFEYLTDMTKVQISKPEEVLRLNNFFQALTNVGLPVPRWALEISDEIKNITTLEYDIEYYTTELIQLTAGVLIDEINHAMAEFVKGQGKHKLRIYSGHAANVAALMAAVGVFDAHQPPYGATFSLELRKRKSNGVYGVVAVYAWDPKDNGRILPMAGCNGELFCKLDTFLNFTNNYAWAKDDYKKNCLKLSETID